MDLMPNALAFEYQAMYGSACRDVNVFDFVNDPNASGVCRVFGPGFLEKASDLPFVERSSLVDDCSDSSLIT